MVVGDNNGVVGLTGFSDKKMSGLVFGPRKSSRNKGVVVWRGSTVCKIIALYKAASKIWFSLTVTNVIYVRCK